MEQSKRSNANKQICRWAGDGIGRHHGVQIIYRLGKAENDLDLRDFQWTLSTENNHPSNVNSSVPAKAFQRYASVFYRVRERTEIKGIRKRKQWVLVEAPDSR